MGKGIGVSGMFYIYYDAPFGKGYARVVKYNLVQLSLRMAGDGVSEFTIPTRVQCVNRVFHNTTRRRSHHEYLYP